MMMEIWQQAVLIGLGLGTLLALVVIPRSLQKDPILSGMPAKVFHAVGTVLFSAVLPSVIVTLILHGGFGTAFPLALSLVGLAYVVLLGYAFFEQPVRAKTQPQDDDLWTAEKAKTSGL